MSLREKIRGLYPTTIVLQNYERFFEFNFNFTVNKRHMSRKTWRDEKGDCACCKNNFKRLGSQQTKNGASVVITHDHNGDSTWIVHDDHQPCCWIFKRGKPKGFIKYQLKYYFGHDIEKKNYSAHLTKVWDDNFWFDNQYERSRYFQESPNCS